MSVGRERGEGGAVGQGGRACVDDGWAQEREGWRTHVMAFIREIMTSATESKETVSYDGLASKYMQPIEGAGHCSGDARPGRHDNPVSKGSWGSSVSAVSSKPSPPLSERRSSSAAGWPGVSSNPGSAQR